MYTYLVGSEHSAGTVPWALSALTAISYVPVLPFTHMLFVDSSNETLWTSHVVGRRVSGIEEVA